MESEQFMNDRPDEALAPERLCLSMSRPAASAVMLPLEGFEKNTWISKN